VIFVRNFARRNHNPFAHDLAQPADHQLPLRVFLQIGHRHALLLQHRVQRGGIHFAAFGEFGRQAVHNRVFGFVIRDPDAQPVGFIRHRAIGNHLLYDLRDVDRQKLRRQLAITRHVLDLPRDLLGGQVLFTDRGDHRRVAVGVRRVPHVGDQVGHHRQADEAQKCAKYDAHSLIPAAKKLKHGWEMLLLRKLSE